MIFSEAKAIVEEVLRPLAVDDFVDRLGAGVLAAEGAPDHVRAGIFGPDPRETVLRAFASHSAQLDCHAVAPSQPPPPAAAVPDEAAFHALVKRFHERDYTVRVPDVVDLSPALQRFARALELFLHQPVSASLFWSKAGAKAIVHYDKQDNIIIQLSGRKRWFISTEPPGLQNNWPHTGEGLPSVARHAVYDVGPGDLIYIPRGTPHTVDSTSESLHLAILFTPVTLRDAIIAAVDHFSDLDRSFRETALGHSRDERGEALAAKVADGVARLLAQCRSPGFVHRAMEHRSSRVIGSLPALAKNAVPDGLGPDSRIRHADLAIAHLMKLPGLVDFSQPGDRIAIHEGAEPALRFIVANPVFRVGDMPGLTDEVRIALVGRLIASGFLRLEA